MSSGALISRRTGLAMLALGTVVLLVVSWLLLSSDQDSGLAASDSEELAQDAESADPDEAEPDESTAALDLAALEVTYDTFLARDPFESVRPPEPVSAENDGTTTETGTGDTGTGTGTGTTNGSNGTTTGEPTGGTDKEAGNVCRTGTEAVCNGSVVVLNSISAGIANVEVNGVSYAVAPGGAFASSYQLLSTSGECADFLYIEGDEAERFTLCIGDSVAK